MGLGTGSHAVDPRGVKVPAKALYISDKVHAICQGGRGGFRLLVFVLCFHVRSPYAQPGPVCNETILLRTNCVLEGDDARTTIKRREVHQPLQQDHYAVPETDQEREMEGQP